MDAILLTQDQFLVINEKFGLDLSYSDAVHYRAALVIWSLWKKPEPADPE